MMKARQSGLTLLELLVTVAIAAILVAVAAPSLTSAIAKRRLDSAANELSANLVSASTEAVSRNGTVSLVTSNAGDAYTLQFNGSTIKSVSFPSGVTGSTAVTVSFQPVRGASNAADIVLASTGLTGTLQVSTNAVGRVTICSPGGAFSGYTAC